MKHSPTIEKQVEKFAKKEWKEILRIKDENHLLYLALLVVLTCGLVLLGLLVINQSAVKFSAGVTEVLPSNNKVLTSNLTGKTSAFTAKVSNVTEFTKPDPAFTLAPDQTLLVLDLSLTNRTTRTQDIIPVSQLFVRSRTGDYSTMHPSIYVTRPLAAGTIKPGETVTGQVSFAVPKQLAQPLLYVDPGWGDQAPLVFDVLR